MVYTKGIKLIEYKELMEEWDLHKNKERNLYPDKLTHGSNKKAWWICKKGHSFEQKISNRTIKKYQCPYCSNQGILPGHNDFATRNPELLSEWDYERNILKPTEVMSGSREKVWWKCSIGHSYQATLNHRTSKDATGCPICFSGRQTSFAEQAIYFYIKKEFPDAINRMKNVFGSKFELDIYIPSINTAIEVDGEPWHGKEKLEREKRKYQLCQQNNIRLIRIREKKYELGVDIADYGFFYEDLYKENILEFVIYELIKFLTMKMYFQMVIDIDIKRDRINILENYQGVKKGSISDVYPEISSEWHTIKNGTLKPTMFTPGSDKKVWWICPICNNEYQATISHRCYGTSCPKCGILKSKNAKSKAVLMIDINTNKTIKIFKSISDASREMNISSGNICMVLKGKRKHTKGFTWKYKE